MDRREIVVPIVKKGGVKDYRGITLTQMTYKINTSILAKRLRTEGKRKAILLPNETRFGTGMGTMNNIYVLNYRIKRQVERRKESMAIMFVDLKDSLDTLNSVDRRTVMKAMRERGVKEGLERVKRCEEVLRKTKVIVRVEEREGEKVWTAKGKTKMFIEF